MYLLLVLAILSAAAHADPFDFRVSRGELVDPRPSARPDEPGLPGVGRVPFVGRRFQVSARVGSRSSTSDTIAFGSARSLTNQRQVVIGGFFKLPLTTDRKSFVAALR